MPFRKTFRLLLAIAILGFASSLITHAQENKSAPRKFDEFGDINLSELKARLDNFTIELQNNPESKGYIIVYRSRRDLPGLNSRLLNRTRNYLLYVREFSTDRIVTVDGGPATNLTQELWVVPPGQTPTVREDAYSIVVPDLTSSRKFDEYYYFTKGETGEEGPDEPGAGDEYPGGSLKAFAMALATEPHATAYVIVYPEYQRGVALDRPGTAQRMMKGTFAELSKEYGLSASRIRLVDGGYRRQRSVELWIVPAGEHPPIATPNAFPPKRRSAGKRNHLGRARSPKDQSTLNLLAPGTPLPQQQTGSTGLNKYDEYGEVKSSDAKARLDNFAIELQNRPNDVGFIVSYRRPRDLPGLTAEKLSWMKEYLVGSRGQDADRLITIDGGVAPNVVYEFWVGSAGSRPPRRADAIPLVIDTKSVRKFDDTFYALYPYEEGEGGWLGTPFPAFAASVLREPAATAYVVAYPQYATINWHDRHGRALRRTAVDPGETAAKMLKTVRAELMKSGLTSDRIKLTNGGYRKERAVELWIVPAGEHPPIATPNAFPPGRKQR
jgi:hypothetical protein